MVFDALGKRVVEVSDYLGETTNNVAEYEAVLRGLNALLKEFGEGHLKTVGVLVKMDSELVIKQMRGEYKVKHPNLIGRHLEIKNLLARHFGAVEFMHIPREQNKDADELANEAMDRKN